MKLEVDLDYDQADKIAVENLRALAANLQYDLRSRKEGTGMAIFDADKDKDIKLLKEHIKAFKTVIKYYAGDL